MKTKLLRINELTAGRFLIATLLVLSAISCASHSNKDAASIQSTSQTLGEPESGQLCFDTDDQVADALVAAAQAHDEHQVHKLLGPGWKDLLSGDKVEDTNAFNEFAKRAAEHRRIERLPGGLSILHVGADDWAYPIPIVQSAEGKWFLDAEAGRHELLARRIGKNELEAIQICRIYVKAQREYHGQPRDGGQVATYAQKIISMPGKMDGLYWKVPPGGQESPFGHLIAEAKLEGYQPTPGKHGPYHGYHFRVLTRQGSAAPGGKKDYVVNGKMLDGFSLIAYPVEYGASGIMTFIVNQDGVVFQKDLGPDTMADSRGTKTYDPDDSWKPVKE